MIPGIVAVVFASQVDTKWKTGDAQGSLRSSRNARLWAVVAGAIEVVTVVLYLVFVFVVRTHGS
jgi:hypothetical protein